MKNITLFPFPYKITANGELNDGMLCSAPLFCKKQFNSKRCRDHYAKVLSSSEFVRCPYGFASKKVDICGFTVINTCLNIETYSDKKSTQKRTSNKDYLPRFSTKYYENVLVNIRAVCNDNREYYDSLASEESAFSTMEEQKELLNNTFHELRKLNQQLKTQAEHLIFQSNNVSEGDITRIHYLSQNIFSTSQLISIRLNTYDFGINPELTTSENKSKIQVHNKFYKVVQCLREYANQNHLRIEISGESHSYIYANDVIELLPYLLLDNAIKYSHPNEKIRVHFDEYEDSLTVLIKGLSIRPREHEVKQLFERGVRSDRVESVQGQGIGLFLAKYICDIHNIDVKIDVGNNLLYRDSKVYSDFTVRLDFKNVLVPDSVS